jgi:hypothetical protein
MELNLSGLVLTSGFGVKQPLSRCTNVLYEGTVSLPVMLTELSPQELVILAAILVLIVLTGEIFIGLVVLLLVRILGVLADIRQTLTELSDNDSPPV